VLATQCLVQKKMKNMLRHGRRPLPAASPAKDLVLAIIGASAPPAAPATPSSSAAAIRALSHGRPHDGVQHGHRGRRARRHGGGGRHHHRLRQGPPFATGRRRLGPGRGLLAHAASDPGAKFDTRWSNCDAARHRAAGQLGHLARDGAVDRGRGAGSGQGARCHAQARASSARSQYMGLKPNTPIADIKRRQGVHRLVHQLAHRGPARRRGRGQGASARGRKHQGWRWWCPAPGW
jgi:hypothetical protein